MPEEQLEFELMPEQKRNLSKKRPNPHSAFIIEQKKQVKNYKAQVLQKKKKKRF